ncbi:MAG: sulfatase-like hydrolase/transferase [Acidobacteria bacterium]|nr:sulfatase-like hydrolase/transferase [Acidobacteriota bacterium]
MLKSRGYDTACFGKWHLGYPDKFSPIRHGFDEYFGILGGNADYFRHTEEDGANVLRHNETLIRREGYLTDLIGDAAVRWLRRRSRKPFFLYVPFNAPHSPYQSHRQREIPEGGWNKGDRRTYAEMVAARAWAATARCVGPSRAFGKAEFGPRA